RGQQEVAAARAGRLPPRLPRLVDDAFGKGPPPGRGIDARGAHPGPEHEVRVEPREGQPAAPRFPPGLGTVLWRRGRKGLRSTDLVQVGGRELTRNRHVRAVRFGVHSSEPHLPEMRAIYRGTPAFRPNMPQTASEDGKKL